jgi:hypothetical protein
LTVDALTDFLPLDVTLDVKTVRHDALKVAECCGAELGEEQWSFIEGCPQDWGNLPISDGPIPVGIDGGYVRDWEAKRHNFEVIVGKSPLAFKRNEEDETPSSKRFGFVQTVDTKPKRRLFEVLESQGFQLNQQITFLSDGEETVRELQLYMSPEAEHILDWHHVTMRLEAHHIINRDKLNSFQTFSPVQNKDPAKNDNEWFQNPPQEDLEPFPFDRINSTGDEPACDQRLTQCAS